MTDKSTGLSIFKELAWFAYKVSGVMWSASVCEYCWSIEGWIHSFLVPCARRPSKIANCSSFSLLALVPFYALLQSLSLPELSYKLSETVWYYLFVSEKLRQLTKFLV